MAASSVESDKHLLFQLNMVLAIGSVRLFRTAATGLHPFGFFTAALEAKPPSSSSFSTLEDIENLLLVARFGLFYNIGGHFFSLFTMYVCRQLTFRKVARSGNLVDCAYASA